MSLLKNPLKPQIPHIILLFIGLSFSVQAQHKTGFKEITFDTNLDSQLFHSSDSILNPLTLLTENGVYDGLPDSARYEIQSTCQVNGDDLRTMRFVDVSYKSDDTTLISIEETNPMFSQTLQIEIANDMFAMNFSYDMSGPQIDREIKTLDQRLTLSKSLENSSFVLGQIYFKGLCVKGCEDETIEIVGDFKTKIK